MKLPKNMKLPFFAYGLFKPGQLAFHIIHELVKVCKTIEVQGNLKDRDGIPIFVDDKKNRVMGFLINFKDGCESDAFKRITKFEVDSYYYWKEITTNTNVKCNILFGKSPNKGTNPYDFGSNWDGKNDPYFNEALTEIKSILMSNKNSDLGPNNPIPFFRLQMAYMLLWTSIERYASMKYYFGSSINERIKLMGEDEIFVKSLIKNVERKNSIVSAKDLKSKI